MTTDLLLDTHVALWWAEEPSQLAAEVIALIADPANDVWVSAASAWELSIKVRAGRLEVDVGRLFDGLARQGVRVLGIGVDDAINAGGLDWEHRDPFDRMLVAQARRNGLTLATRDTAILRHLTAATLTA